MKRLWLVLLLGSLLTGCGAEAKQEGKDMEVQGKEIEVQGNKVEAGGKGIVAGEMAASLIENEPLVFQYEVKNQTEQEVTLEFTSSQRFDYSVKTADGKEIFLFSSVASFLQALGEEKVKQGESLTYDIDLHELNLEKGSYLLSVWMTPKDGPQYKTEKEFVIE